MVEIISYVVLGLGILTGVILVLCLLDGLIKGFSKKLTALISLVLAAVLFLITVNVVAPKVSNIKMSIKDVEPIVNLIDSEVIDGLSEEEKNKDYTLAESLTVVLTNIVYSEDPSYAEDSKLTVLVEGLVQMIIKVSIYLSGIFILVIFKILISIIVKILRRIIFKGKLERTKPLFGMLLGLGSFVVIFVLFITPLYGILSTAKVVFQDAVDNREVLSIDEDTAFNLQGSADKIENSVVRKIAFGLPTKIVGSKTKFDADALYLGTLLSFKVDDTKVKFLDEYNNISEAIVPVLKIVDMVNDAQDGKISFSSLTAEDLDNLKNLLADNKLLQVALPGVCEYVAYTITTDESNTPSDSIIKAVKSLKTLDWSSELKTLSEIFDIIKKYNNAEVDVSNFSTVLKSKDFIDMLEEIVNKVLDLNLVGEVLLPIGMEEAAKSLETNENLKDFGFNYDILRATVWKDEIKVVVDVIFKVADAANALNFDQEKWMDIFENEDIETHLNDIIDRLLESKVLSDFFLPGLANKINQLVTTAGEGVDLSFVADIVDEDSIVDLLENDVNTIISVFQTVVDLGLVNGKDGINFKDENVRNQVIDAVKDIFSLSVIKGKESTIFEGLLGVAGVNETLEQFGITLDFDKVTSWDDEIDCIGNIISDVLSLTDNIAEFDFEQLLSNTSEEQKESVAKLVEDMSKSAVFGDSMFNLINKLLESFDSEYAITFTESDKLVISSETGWKKETLVILNIVDNAKVLLESDTSDYASFDAETIKNIMLEASEGVIATKVVGNVLNQLFKDSAVNYDFTVRANMANCADTVFSAIKLAQKMSSAEDLDFNNPDTVDEILNVLDDLGGNLLEDEGNVEFINSLINETLVDTASGDLPVEISKEDLSEVSGVMGDIISAYQSSANQDTFSKDDLPQDLKDKLEGNDLADLVFGYFFN